MFGVLACWVLCSAERSTSTSEPSTSNPNLEHERGTQNPERRTAMSASAVTAIDRYAITSPMRE